MMKKNQRSLKKKRNKCNKGILKTEFWFIVKQTATVCSMVEKNPETALKKRNKCNKGILYAVLCFIVKQTATRFVQ